MQHWISGQQSLLSEPNRMRGKWGAKQILATTMSDSIILYITKPKPNYRVRLKLRGGRSCSCLEVVKAVALGAPHV